jgi:cell division protein FtsN
MGSEVGEEKAPRQEIRIQGIALFVTGGALLALLALAFWAGRWFERQLSPAGPAGGQESSAYTSQSEPKAEDLTFFDALGGSGSAAEPHREAGAKATRAEAATSVAESPVARSGPFFVQVFAGRDRDAAEEVVRSLRSRGYPVAVEGEREGQGTLFKVRVGGYRDRAEALVMADRLQREGQAGAWVTRRD